MLGDAGMGKTSLLASAAQRGVAAGSGAPGDRQGVGGEPRLRRPAQLLAPVLDGAADLPERQAQALRALGLGVASAAPTGS